MSSVPSAVQTDSDLFSYIIVQLYSVHWLENLSILPCARGDILGRKNDKYFSVHCQNPPVLITLKNKLSISV